MNHTSGQMSNNISSHLVSLFLHPSFSLLLFLPLSLYLLFFVSLSLPPSSLSLFLPVWQSQTGSVQRGNPLLNLTGIRIGTRPMSACGREPHIHIIFSPSVNHHPSLPPLLLPIPFLFSQLNPLSSSPLVSNKWPLLYCVRNGSPLVSNEGLSSSLCKRALFCFWSRQKGSPLASNKKPPCQTLNESLSSPHSLAWAARATQWPSSPSGTWEGTAFVWTVKRPVSTVTSVLY